MRKGLIVLICWIEIIGLAECVRLQLGLFGWFVEFRRRNKFFVFNLLGSALLLLIDLGGWSARKKLFMVNIRKIFVIFLY